MPARGLTGILDVGWFSSKPGPKYRKVPDPSGESGRIRRRGRKFPSKMLEDTDPEGRVVRSKRIVGRKTGDGPGESLSPQEAENLARTLTDDFELWDDGHGGWTLGSHRGLRSDLRRGRVESLLTTRGALHHELGHGLSISSGLQKYDSDALRMGWAMRQGIVKSPEEWAALRGEMIAESRRARPDDWAIADGGKLPDGPLSEEGFSNTHEGWRGYLNEPDELLADNFRQYMTNPDAYKRRAPNAARFIRGLVNTDPVLGPEISFVRHKPSEPGLSGYLGQ